MSIKIKHLIKREKIGTALDKEIILKIKEKALKEGRTISEIIEEAVLKYDEIDNQSNLIRKSAVKSFCSKPFNLNSSEISALLNEDYYG